MFFELSQIKQSVHNIKKGSTVVKNNKKVLLKFQQSIKYWNSITLKNYISIEIKYIKKVLYKLMIHYQL